VKNKKSLSYKQNLTNTFWGFFSIIDSIATSAIYTCYVKPSFASVYDNTLKFIILPVYALDSVIAAIAAWYLAHIERNEDDTLKTGKVVYAVITTLASIAMIGAAVFGLLVQFKLTLLAPLFFAANMAVNAFYNLGASIYYAGKSAGTTETDKLIPSSEGEEPTISKKQFYRAKAIGHGTAGILATGMAVIAMVVVPLAKTVFAPVGIVLGCVGLIINIAYMVTSIRKIIALHKANQTRKMSLAIDGEEKKPAPANTAEIQRRLPPAVATRAQVRGSASNTSLSLTHQPTLWNCRDALLDQVDTEPLIPSTRSHISVF
jgi:hypothetical protein